MMQKKFPAFLENFRRVTSAGNYIPEIDGLRFVSICWVVVLLHGMNLVNQKMYSGSLITNKYWLSVFLEGGYGVSLFMMISGFVLALPFIRQKLLDGPRVSLKKYYLRRLTRLEPPYIVALTISFILLVFVLGRYSFGELLPHYGASAIYMHNIFYNQDSLVLGVAWSLEIEVQFYLIMPLLSLIFLIKTDSLRRGILVVATVLTAVYAYHKFWTLPVILPNFICYFLAGMLLADLYCKPPLLKVSQRPWMIVGLLIIVGLPLLISIHSLGAFMAKMILIFIFFYLVLFNPQLKKIMSGKLITIIGGMCYSIYLLHLLIMSAVAQGMLELTFGNVPWKFLFYLLTLLAAVLVLSAVFFKLVEQPCMRKDWWKSNKTKKETSRTGEAG